MASLGETVIHPTAIVDSAAELGYAVTVGPFSIIEGNVCVGRGTRIASHVLLASGARLGEECRIAHGAVLGTIPQDLKFGGEESELVVGDRTLVREFCTLNRGTAHGHRVTSVGKDCMLMAYCHVAHDCSLGDNVIMANCVNLAGHVAIEDWVSVGGLTVIHQFVKIGRHAFVGGRSRITQDIPPYILTSGEPMAYYGPNAIGLHRRGFTSHQIETIKKAYNLLYRSKLNVKQAVEAIRSEVEQTPEVQDILRFVGDSNRGLIGLWVKDERAAVG